MGDVIPYEEDGVLHLFYLHESRRLPKEGMPWHRITTENLVDFQERGLAIASGGPAADDFNIYTGSIVRDGSGLHHAFYTGQNPTSRGRDGHPLQLVMHATSDDGMSSWMRHPEHTFGATPGYETGDWRDPFVFRDEEAGLWRMLVTARHVEGPARRRGVIAQCTSMDLETWEPAAPFWDPRRGVAYECPEVFQWGEWWYLVSSEFSDAFVTRYRMARSVDGPWIAPDHDTLDGRAYYAAKSASLGGRRLFFGWIASREASRDDGEWQWAGTLSVLEAEQNADGTLAFHTPREARETFTDATNALAPGTTIAAPDGHAQLVSTHDVPDSFRLTARFDASEGAREFGVLLRASEDGDESYVLRLEPRRGRLVFDRWPRKSTGEEQWQISGDVPFAIELERPAMLTTGEHVLDVIVDDDICVATLDDAVVLSTRLYDRPSGRVGVFVDDGELLIKELTVRPSLPRVTARVAEPILATAHT